ncbi:MAG: ATP-binding cassette domain-containing protein [Planctomycetes bacterium]|nr:ATP-binding cassette domain-containing protein [Planctomycetota bacterium]
MAADGVTFSARGGEVFGLLGPNGAGKTTTLRMLSTVLTPTSGTALIAGHDVVHEPDAVRASIGFLSGNTGLYPRLTPREVLRYFGRMYGMNGAQLEGRIDELATLLDMTDFLGKRCDALSSGMKQKVNVARTVLHDPPVLILDEPTVGLDVLKSRTIVNLVKDCRTQGKCVIFSTHIMGEVSRLCDRLGRQGIRAAAKILEGDAAHQIISCCGPADALAATTHGFGGIKHLVFGSVAEKLFYEAPVPTFIYKSRRNP